MTPLFPPFSTLEPFFANVTEHQVIDRALFIKWTRKGLMVCVYVCMNDSMGKGVSYRCTKSEQQQQKKTKKDKKNRETDIATDEIGRNRKSEREKKKRKGCLCFFSLSFFIYVEHIAGRQL